MSLPIHYFVEMNRCKRVSEKQVELCSDVDRCNRCLTITVRTYIEVEGRNGKFSTIYFYLISLWVVL